MSNTKVLLNDNLSSTHQAKSRTFASLNQPGDPIPWPNKSDSMLLHDAYPSLSGGATYLSAASIKADTGNSDNLAQNI